MKTRHSIPSRLPPAVPRARGNAGVLLAILALLLPLPARAFTATDASTNEPYAETGQWNLGDNGGTGFTGWSQVGSAATPNRSLDNGFAIYANAGVGEAAIGRTFADGTALATGQFSVDAAHGSADAFSGFALYAANDTELLRWGVTTAENRETGAPATGIWYAPLAGGSPGYTLLSASSSEDILSSRIAYSVTWTLVESRLSVDLSVSSTPLTDTFHLTLDTSSAVTAVAALVAGSTQAETLHFDNLSVEGSIVPEPSALALLLLGTLALRPRRRK